LNRVMRSDGMIAQLTGEGEADNELGDATTEFRRFLVGLQGDLLSSVREFVEGELVEEVIEETEIPVDSLTSLSMAEDVPPSETTDGGVSSDTAMVTSSTPLTSVDSAMPVDDPIPAGESTSSAVPAFHRQPGQIVSGPTPPSGVTGGRDGVPRRLNFFRAHIFPARQVNADASTSSAVGSASTAAPPVRPIPTTSSSPTENSTNSNTAASPATSTPVLSGEAPAPGQGPLVPCIFVGVRSISHAPGVSTEDLVQHPSFPFDEGSMPESDASTTPNTSPPSTDSQLASTTTLPPLSRSRSTPTTSSHPPLIRSLTPNPGTSRPNLRTRLLSRLRRNSTSTTSPSSTSPRTPPLPNANNTYLVYVIGGNYPSNHPILSIPSLITGAPLTDEEMTMIGELMGQVKPPTVSREGIEKAGLRVVRGEEMERMGEEGVVLNSCVERCLVSLFSSIVFVGGFQWLMDAGCRSVWVIMKMERNVGC
jgi:hypothetical protein